MSARTEPCGEFVILTTMLSLSYALRILFLYRVLYLCLRDWRLLAQPFHLLFKLVYGMYVICRRVLLLNPACTLG